MGNSAVLLTFSFCYQSYHTFLSQVSQKKACSNTSFPAGLVRPPKLWQAWSGPYLCTCRLKIGANSCSALAKYGPGQNTALAGYLRRFFGIFVRRTN